MGLITSDWNWNDEKSSRKGAKKPRRKERIPREDAKPPKLGVLGVLA